MFMSHWSMDDLGNTPYDLGNLHIYPILVCKGHRQRRILTDWSCCDPRLANMIKHVSGRFPGG